MWWRRRSARAGRAGAGGEADARLSEADARLREGDGQLREAFAAVPRATFLRAPDRDQAGLDGPLPIGHGQTNSQPRTVADMLRLLDVQPGHRVLDVGAGSGWTTALLATLVGPRGSVLGLEVVPELAAWGADNLRAWAEGQAGAGQAGVELADPAELGHAGAGPWDRILVSAMARGLPEQLIAQLTDDGRMVCPVDGHMLLVQRAGPDRTITSHGAYRFVPLRTPDH